MMKIIKKNKIILKNIKCKLDYKMVLYYKK